MLIMLALRLKSEFRLSGCRVRIQYSVGDALAIFFPIIFMNMIFLKFPYARIAFHPLASSLTIDKVKISPDAMHPKSLA